MTKLNERNGQRETSKGIAQHYLSKKYIHNLHYSSHVIMGMKSKKVKSVGPEKDTEYAMNVYRILVGNPERKNHLG
jgi:hypothetical protein